MSRFNRYAGATALATLAAALMAPVAIHAQETTAVVRGEITGAGAPLAGASVTLTHVPSGTRAVSRTNAGGQFVASGLRVGGPYRIDVTAPNFVGATIEDVTALAGEPFSLVLNLDPQEREVTTVVVSGTRVGAAAADGASTTSLRRDAIVAVTAINRDIRELARRSPLASQNTRGDGGISIAGSNPRTNRITIDGTSAQDDFGLNTGGLPTRRGPVSIDAVQQFSISATPYDVRNGGFTGGAIDVVLRAGDNDFDGSVFANFIDQGLTGSRIRNTVVNNTVEQENWGATLRGPILKDRLFFALSYETFESVDASAFGPAGQGFANTINGPSGGPLTQAEIDAVTNVWLNTYRSTFDVGSIPLTAPVTDEKMTARIDWNINDDHRAQFTYRNSESGLIQRTNINAGSAGLSSQWYLTGEVDENYVAQVNSNWTDALSTEVRFSYRDYTRLQEPPSGQQFADIRVCSTATALDTGGVDPLYNCRLANNTTGAAPVRFGPDQFRHANFLNTKNTQGQFEAKYLLGDHTIKAGLQWQQREVFNLFVAQSDGVYYFDSIADFRAGLANELVYNNHPSGDPNRAAAEFTYSILSGYLQDTWRLSDTLRVTAGFRLDAYTSDDQPFLNTNFRNRFGFSNQTTYDGLSIFQPRASFKWDAAEDIEITGGAGLFAGGSPDVFISNAFSNTGVATVSTTIRRLANGTFIETGNNPAFTQAIGAAALNGLARADFGTTIPAGVQSLLGGATPPAAAETATLSPNFEIPSDWKFNLSGRWNDAFWGVDLDVDAVYTLVRESLAYRDLRASPLIVNGQQARTPDGRIRYDSLSAAQRAAGPGVGLTVNSTAALGGGLRDIQLFNPGGDLGGAFTIALQASKEWFDGFETTISYTFQNAEELSNSSRFGSTPGTLYSDQLSDLDPNNPAFGRAQEEITHSVKYSVDWRATPFGDLETRLSLFGDSRSGRPISFIMNGGGQRNTVFGVNKAGQLAYIPNLSGASTPTQGTGVVTIASDTKVSFDTVATLNSLVTFVNRFGLPQGGILPRGVVDSPDINLVDVKLSQELPALRKGDQAFITFEIGNLLNLMNENWGVIEDFADSVRVFDVTCADANGVSTTAAAPITCARYRISGVNDPDPARLAASRNTDRSRWQIQVGLRYEF
jgi:Carboxypeptidase regulatory-like domain/TonB dependent receptor